MLHRPRRPSCIRCSRRARAAVPSVLALALLGIAAPAAAGEPPPLEVVVHAGAVGVGGLAPGSAVAWLGAGRQALGASQRLVAVRQVALDETGSGEAFLDLAPAVPATRAFVAVDLATGALGWAGPAGAELEVAGLPAGVLAGLSDESIAALRLPHGWLEVLVVRPGAGAWGLRLADGGSADADGATDGWVATLLAALEPVAGVETAGLPGLAAAPPAALAAGDLVVAVDLDTLTVYAARIGGAR